jgi:hypothetical protein
MQQPSLPAPGSVPDQHSCWQDERQNGALWVRETGPLFVHVSDELSCLFFHWTQRYAGLTTPDAWHVKKSQKYAPQWWSGAYKTDFECRFSKRGLLGAEATDFFLHINERYWKSVLLGVLWRSRCVLAPLWSLVISAPRVIVAAIRGHCCATVCSNNIPIVVQQCFNRIFLHCCAIVAITV